MIIPRDQGFSFPREDVLKTEAPLKRERNRFTSFGNVRENGTLQGKWNASNRTVPFQQMERLNK